MAQLVEEDHETEAERGLADRPEILRPHVLVKRNEGSDRQDQVDAVARQPDPPGELGIVEGRSARRHVVIGLRFLELIQRPTSCRAQRSALASSASVGRAL